MDGITNKEAGFDLQLTAHTLRSLLNAIPESLFLIDRQGVILEANEPFAERFGKNLAECLGMNIYDLLSPDVAEHRKQKVAEVLHTGKRISFEGELEGDRMLQGRKIHHLCPLFDSNGEVERLVIFSQDITELKRTEESLIAAQSFLDEDLDAMSRLHEISTLFVRESNITVIFEKVIDAALVITGTGMGTIRLLDPGTGSLKLVAQKGFTLPVRECGHDSSLGPCLCDIVMQRKEQITLADITKCLLIWGQKEIDEHLADGVKALQLTPLVNRNGELLGLLTTYFSVIFNPEERVLKLLDLLASQTADIIERDEKAEALRQSEEHRRLALEAAKSGSWSWDCKTHRNVWSEELWTLYGLDRQNGEPSCDLWPKTMHPDDCERVEKLVQEAVSNGSELHAEWRVLDDEGRERWLMARGKTLHNSVGEPLKMIGIVMDITESKRSEQCSIESNTRYSSLFDNMPNGIAYCRMIFEEERPVDFIYEQVNARFEVLTGLKNVEGKRVSEVLPGILESIPDLLEIYGRVAKTGQPDRFEFYLEALSMWLDISVYSIKKEYFTAVFDVITERKQIENALRKSEKKFRSITEQMAEVVFVTDNLGQLTYVSPAVETIFGYAFHEVIGHPITDFLVEEDVPRLIEIFNEALSQQFTIQVFEFRYRKKNGSVFYGEVHVHSYYENGLFALIGLIRDITERKRNEAVMEFRVRMLQLSESSTIEEVMRETLDEAEKLTGSTIGFIHLLEPDQVTISLQAWSSNTERNLCGVDDFRSHYPLKDAGVWADAIRERRVLIHNNYDALPNRKGMPQGHVKVHRELVVPILRGGKITAIMGIGNKPDDYDQDDVSVLTTMAGIAWDIIARKQAELSEIRIQNELVQAQKMELVGRLAGGIAHDFNNMLCVILGHTEMALVDNPFNESLNASLREIFNAAEKSADLTHHLLAFARKQPLIPKVLDLNVVIEGTLNMLRRLIGAEITLVWHPDQYLSLVNMDSSHIDQILVNLCVNARDAISGSGKILIETKNITFLEHDSVNQTDISSGEYVMLSVSDNGCGIDKEDAGYIFEPFFTTKELGKGTGLGLSTVYGIVKQNNGLIKFSSEPGKGTDFRVYFPKYTGNAEITVRTKSAGTVKSGEETILIVDDEKEILKLSTLILQKNGYHVLTADTPTQAIQIAEEQTCEIHLLLTDIIMPEMNGRDLSRKMLSIYPNIKTLFMSGYTADIIATQGVTDEVRNLIYKPFSVKGLTKKVHDTLHASPTLRE
jgi:two-component system, cell cycle sensor histidine kinase and response regulator CckA